MSNSTYDAIVIGGGVMGCSITYSLAKLGKKVLLIERDELTKGSAGATDGVVGYHTKKPGEQMELAIKSIELFDSLEEELGEDIEYCADCGGMQPVETKDEWDILSKIVEEQKQSGVDIEMISIEEAKRLEPELSDKLYGALYSKTGKKVNPLKLTLAYAKCAKRLGATILIEEQVSEILTKEVHHKENENNSIDKVINKQVVGVRTNKGTYYSDYVINSCGAASSKVADLVGVSIPIKPRKGQLIVTEPIGKFLTSTVQCARYNVIKFRPELVTDEDTLKYGLSLSIEQQDDGSLIIGGTREMVDFDTENTLEALEGMIKRAIKFFPRLKNINFIRSFAGLRPYTPDGLPILGETKVEGFYIAAGHEGDGIALAPITGKLIAEQIVYNKTSHPLDSFSPNRFLY